MSALVGAIIGGVCSLFGYLVGYWMAKRHYHPPFPSFDNWRSPGPM